jgi:hypothetical protein
MKTPLALCANAEPSPKGHLTMKPVFVLAALALAASAPSFAQSKGGGSGGSSSGVITIDQARAEAGGVTPGDAPGFPVTISQPGSYRLAGNLNVAAANLRAIEITADNVTLDLAGFAIVGPVACSGTPPGGSVSCTPASNGTGVYAASRNGVAIRDGAVRGFGYGVINGWLGSVERVRISHVTEYGIYGDTGTQVAGNSVDRSGGHGIYGYADVRDNAVRWAQGAGIGAGFGAIVTGNRIAGVGAWGISAYMGGNAAVGHNSITNAGAGGIYQGISLGGNVCNGAAC